MADAVITKIFSTMDSDDSGSITKDEINVFFKLFDKDGNGSVSKEEWTESFLSNFNGNTAQAEKAFNFINRAGKSEINIDALYDMFKSMDVNGDGEVSKGEFQEFWIKIIS